MMHIVAAFGLALVVGGVIVVWACRELTKETKNV